MVSSFCKVMLDIIVAPTLFFYEMAYYFLGEVQYSYLKQTKEVAVMFIEIQDYGYRTNIDLFCKQF